MIKENNFATPVPSEVQPSTNHAPTENDHPGTSGYINEDDFDGQSSFYQTEMNN